MLASPTELDIASLRAAYANGLSPEDLLADVAQRIEAYPRRGVWTYVLKPREIESQLAALAKARQANAALPLYGVPFAVKDNIDVAGVPTTAACPAYAYVPETAAGAVRRLTDAGAIVVGKANLDQFATGLVGIRSPYGACENAYDPAYISGGSSSGSAVAVAGGLVSFSLGTDTAGSGRVPAAFNNLVGLKPTRGLISVAGMVPACRSLDCVSVFAKTCADARCVMDVMAGFDGADPLSRRAPRPEGSRHTPCAVKPCANGTRSVPATLTVGVPNRLEFFGNHDAQRLFASAVEQVRRLDAEVLEIDFAPFLRAGDLLYNGPWAAERLLATGALLAENPAALRPELRAILLDAQRYSAADAFQAMHQLAVLRRQAEEQFARMDLLLAPTAGTIYRIAEVAANPMQLNRNLGYYTNFVNLLDLCAVAVPAGFLPSRLPWGVTFIAPAFQESAILSFAARFCETDNMGTPS